MVLYVKGSVYEDDKIKFCQVCLAVYTQERNVSVAGRGRGSGLLGGGSGFSTQYHCTIRGNELST